MPGMRRISFALVAVAALAGCSRSLPPRWAEGGQRIDVPRARWQRGSEAVDLLDDGRVLVDGDQVLAIDRAGRVYDADGDPVAILAPDGNLWARGGEAWGFIGLHNASLPGGNVAWLGVGDDGAVIRYDDEGERRADGVWAGCGPALRTCTLVTHVIALREARARPRMGFGIGIGVGFGR